MPRMKFIPCINVLKSEGDLSARMSWLLNYILAYARPMEASITLTHGVVSSTKNPLFDSHPLCVKALSRVVSG